MIIFVKTPTEETIPVEAERSDTIAYVKGIIKDKKGVCELDQRLVFCWIPLEDGKTLADYNIQNQSTLHLSVDLRGGTDVLIRASSGKSVPTGGVQIWDRIYSVKAKIEDKSGIPMDEQRLMYAGKQLDNDRWTLDDYDVKPGSTLRFARLGGDDAVDIADVEARKRARRSKAKGTGNRAEAATMLPEVGSKRAREGSSSTAPRRLERGLSLCGANCAEGVESFWDEEDFGLALRRFRPLINPYDTSRFESEADRTLIESVANDCVRTINVMAVLESHLEEYKDSLIRAENEVKRLTEENARWKESLQKETDKCKKLVQELDMERSTGTFFLQSKCGRHHIVTLERQAGKSAVDDFKKSDVFNELVMDRAESVYDDAVRECQRLLRKSGRVSEDIIQLIDPQNSDQEENDDDDDDEEDEDEEDEDEGEDEDKDEDE